MKRTLLSLILALSLVVPVLAHNRTQVIALGTQSVVQITQALEGGATSLCTAFVVNQKRGLLLTAKHCADDKEGEVKLGTAVLKIVKTSDALTLLQTQQTIGSSLEIRGVELDLGEEVIALGFGFGHYTPVIRHITEPHAHYDQDSKTQDDIVLDGPLAPGMSGGPVLDGDGKVVGVNQQNSPNYILSLACGQNEIRAFLKGA